MVLRKILIDNSVKKIAQSNQTQGRDIKTIKMKNNSLPRKQNKKFSKDNKKVIAKISAEALKKE